MHITKVNRLAVCDRLLTSPLRGRLITGDDSVEFLYIGKTLVDRLNRRSKLLAVGERTDQQQNDRAQIGCIGRSVMDNSR